MILLMLFQILVQQLLQNLSPCTGIQDDDHEVLGTHFKTFLSLNRNHTIKTIAPGRQIADAMEANFRI